VKKWEQRNHRNSWTDKEVEAHWDRVASVYVAENTKVKHAHDQRFYESMHYLQLEDSHKVLNITSRDAEADDFIKKSNPKVDILNAEISSGLMAVAHHLRPHIRQVKIATYSSLPFDDARFDRILSLETLEHAADPLSFLKELARISTPEARLVLSCPPHTSELPYRIYTALFGGHGEGPHRFLPSAEVKAMLHKSGWKLLMHKGTVLIPVGPLALQNFGEKIINRLQKTWVSELGIRQFYVCEKY